MLDRAVQRQILELLREHYPRGATAANDLKLGNKQAAANLRYLEEHGLCKSGMKLGEGVSIQFSQSIEQQPLASIFAADDGGLSTCDTRRRRHCIAPRGHHQGRIPAQ